MRFDSRNPDATAKELQGFHKALTAIAKDTNGAMDLKARFIKKDGSGDEVRSEFSLKTSDARIIQSNIRAEQIERQSPTQVITHPIFPVFFRPPCQDPKTLNPWVHETH